MEDRFGFIVFFGTLEEVDSQNGVIKQPEGNLIAPRVVGAKSNLPAIWVPAAISAVLLECCQVFQQPQRLIRQ